jgi:hypothetical protein
MPWKERTIVGVLEVEAGAKAVGVAQTVAAVEAEVEVLQKGAGVGPRQAMTHGMFLAVRPGHVVALQTLPEVATALRPMQTLVGSARVAVVFRLTGWKPHQDNV